MRNQGAKRYKSKRFTLCASRPDVFMDRRFKVDVAVGIAQDAFGAKVIDRNEDTHTVHVQVKRPGAPIVRIADKRAAKGVTFHDKELIVSGLENPIELRLSLDKLLN